MECIRVGVWTIFGDCGSVTDLCQGAPMKVNVTTKDFLGRGIGRTHRPSKNSIDLLLGPGSKAAGGENP